GMLLTTVEAIYAYRMLKHWRSRGTSVLRYRLAEAILLITFLKLLSFADKPLAQIWVELQLMWRNPINILTVEFYLILGLAAISWLAATYTIGDFEALYDPYTFRTDRVLPLQELMNRFAWGGIGLVLLSGTTYWVARNGISSLADWQRPSAGGVVVNVLVYFVLGLVLISQANLTRLMVRWQVQKVRVEAGLIKQWARYALIFIGLVAALVFLLPTSYTLGFLASAGLMIQYLFGLIMFVVQLIIFLITLPIVWLLSLLEVTSPDSVLGGAPPPSLSQFNPANDAETIPWLEVLRSFLFWTIILLILGYFLRVYLQDHPTLLQSLRRFKPVALLFDIVARLWQQLWGLTQAGLAMLPIPAKGLSQTADGIGPGSGWFGLTRLTPRERILSYYRNLLERAEQHGSGRAAHQTPFEYEPTLGRAAPEAREDVGQLTKIFVEVRYGRQVVNKAEASQVKQIWQRIKRGLRQARKEEYGD
ncbi:MAG: DUF4129 domain-containing protein, partial [Anaerolineae bacterium]|nr:DUF4129 domain-containing protein [Anaerolineae bacterium]